MIGATMVIAIKDYYSGTCLYLCAEPLHPGAKASLFVLEGHWVTAFFTNAPRYSFAFVDARYRDRARCENRIRTLKASGREKLPFHAFDQNQLCTDSAILAMNLVTQMQMIILPEGHAAALQNTKHWRNRLFSIATKSFCSNCQTRLLARESVPESQLFCAIFEGTNRLRQRWHHG